MLVWPVRTELDAKLDARRERTRDFLDSMFRSAKASRNTPYENRKQRRARESKVRRGLIAAAGLVLLALSGCTMVGTKPVDAKCSDKCKPCETLTDWDGSLTSAVNLLGEYGAAYGRCSDSEAACEQCLDRLRSNNVID